MALEKISNLLAVLKSVSNEAAGGYGYGGAYNPGYGGYGGGGRWHENESDMLSKSSGFQAAVNPSDWLTPWEGVQDLLILRVVVCWRNVLSVKGNYRWGV